jgi:hypothetical protein
LVSCFIFSVSGTSWIATPKIKHFRGNFGPYFFQLNGYWAVMVKRVHI